jgi:HAMP domain-containing protein
MIVICEECGKRYQIDPGKIKGRQARFNCKKCGHAVTVTKPEEEKPLPPAVDLGATQSDAPEPPPAAAAAEEPGSTGKEKGKKEKKEKREKKERKAALPTRLGLRGKMILLFFLVPILCIAAAGWLYIQQLKELSTLITDESTEIVNQMAELNIAETADSVAAECAVYLKTHPGLPETRFNEDPEFSGIAVQKVGKTGYTALYELPGPDGVWRTWAHVNPKIIGIDMKNLQKPLGKSFPGFWRVYTGVRKGKASRGYYTWQDKDGAFRDKFMVCTPVEGTPYIVAATTYLYEFTRPMIRMTEQAQEQTRQTQNFLLYIIAGTLVLIGLLVSAYGHVVTQRIKHLTEAAERISVGELDTEIEVRSKDEIGDLGEAISRMQDSIRLSLERLRRRR